MVRSAQTVRSSWCKQGAAAATAGTEMPLTIQEAKARHAPSILALPGVVSVGIGRDAEGREVIVIGLDGARPETRAQLPAEPEGYRVEVRLIGPVKAQ
jgi:hypothetical protein